MQTQKKASKKLAKIQIEMNESDLFYLLSGEKIVLHDQIIFGRRADIEFARQNKCVDQECPVHVVIQDVKRTEDLLVIKK